jgi:DHA1 family multidrug resistance protein-like MFS transporter
MRLLERWFPAGISHSQVALAGVLAAAEFSRTALIVALLPSYAIGPLGISLTLVGFMISGHYLMDTAFRTPMGWLTDRVGPRVTLLLGMSVEVVALLGAARAHNPVWLVIWLGLLGVGTASHWPAVVTGTNRLSAVDNRGTMMGIVYASWLAGSGLGPVVINFVIGNLGSDRLAFDLLVAADLLAFGLTFLLRDPKLNQIHGGGRPRVSWDGVRHIWPLRAVLPGMFVQTLVLGELLPVLQPLTHQVLHLSQWSYAFLLLGSGAMTVILLVPMGRVSDRMGVKGPLIGGFWLAGASLMGLAFVRDFWWLIVVGGFLGLSYALILPAWNAFLARLIPADQEGLLWGVFMSVEGLGMAVGPVIGAHLFEFSTVAPFALATLILAVMGIFYWFYPLPSHRPG